MLCLLCQTNLDGSVSRTIAREVQVCLFPERIELRLRGALGPHDRVVTVRLQETPDGDQQLQAALAPENSRCCFCLPTPETPETA
jgi:hypothetical protein